MSYRKHTKLKTNAEDKNMTPITMYEWSQVVSITVIAQQIIYLSWPIISFILTTLCRIQFYWCWTF